MNELSSIDQDLLEKIKNSIAQQAGLSGGADMSQKDFDFLLYYIQEHTGQALSLTTLRRIWKNEFQRLPHLSTLNMLGQMAYGQDWHTLKKNSLTERSNTSAVRGSVVAPAAFMPLPGSGNNRRATILKIVAAGILVIAASLGGYYLYSHSPQDFSTIQFSAVATADRRVPNSVVFSYDVHTFKADHYYIQQSWDPAKKIEVSPANSKQTDIYFEPGYHYAKLMGNDQVLKEIPVHICYDDWFVRFRHPDSRLEQVPPDQLHTTGHLGLRPGYVKQLSFNAPFQLGYMLSKDFGMTADELQVSAAIRFDTAFVPPCPMVNLLVKGDKDYAWITLGHIGCESNLGLKVGDTQVSGKTNDLSSWGMEMFDWQQIHFELAGGSFRLSLNNRLVYEGTYDEKLGELKEIDFFFNGIGSIDNIDIVDNHHAGKISQRFN